MKDNRKKSSLEKFLSLFTEVQSGEGRTALLLFFNLLVLLTAYYMMKTVREALILAGSGAEVKSYSAAGQAILLLIAVPLYAKLASRVPRRRLINIVTIFFTVCLVLFYFLGQMGVPLGVIFYLWVGIFNLMVPAQFWAFANDLYTPAAGKRIFVIVAFGASSGSVVGSFLARHLIDPLGVYQLLLLAGALLVLNLIITNIVDSREKGNIDREKNASKSIDEEPVGKGGAFELVFKNKYLLMIAFLMLFLNWVNTTGEYILGRTITEAAHKAVAEGATAGLTAETFIGKFYGDFFTVVNLLGMLMQLFIVSRILKYLGIRIALLFLPVIALFGYGIIAFYPIMVAVRWSKTFENATDYSLQNTVRQVLFLPTTREEKYKAKQAIDTFFVRIGDVLSAVLVYIGTALLAFHTKQFALVNIGLVVVWMILAYRIGKKNAVLTKPKESMEVE